MLTAALSTYGIIIIVAILFIHACTKQDYANTMNDLMQGEYALAYDCIFTCNDDRQLGTCKEMMDQFIRKHESNPDKLQYNYLVGMLANKYSEKKANFEQIKNKQ